MLTLNFSGTIIIHQAFDEPDSVYPNGRTPIDSLHRSGQEAEISMSFEIKEPIIAQDYSTDGSLINSLASMAVCVGFDYVRINPVNKSVSVAVRDCFLQNIRFVMLCFLLYTGQGCTGGWYDCNRITSPSCHTAGAKMDIPYTNPCTRWMVCTDT